jgi:hypothetical protein
LHPLLELSRILNPGVLDEALPPIMAVGFYADESESGRSFTLSGWLASARTGWIDICAEWTRMVAEAPHPISEFHMTDIAQARGDFSNQKGWTQPERDALVKRATDILTDKKLSGGLTAFGCSIVRPNSKEWIEASSYDLYKICYQVLFAQILATFSAFRAFNFVFDQKEKVRKHVEAHFWAAKDYIDQIPGLEGMLRGVAYEPSKDLVPLQAADFLAYERCKRNSDRAAGIQRKRKSYERLLERPHHFKIIDDRYFAAVEARMRQIGKTEDLESGLLIPDDDD